MDPCIDTFGFTSTSQTGTGNDAYTGTDQTFTLNPFNLDPSDLCSATYSCTGITLGGVTATDISCSDLTAAGKLFNPASQTEGGTLTLNMSNADYLSGNYKPGTYTVTVQGTVVGSNSVTAEATYTFTLVDPCDPPTSITAATLTNQSYTITQNDHPGYTHPAFTISPAYCTFDYSYNIADISNLAAGTSAITQATGDDTTFKIHYDSDLLPVGET